jgi:hypothetical protein
MEFHMVRLLSALLALGLIVGFATAEDKKEEKPKYTGVWVKEVEGATLEFNFDKAESLIVTAKADDKVITIKCKYSVDKNGLISAKAESVDNKNEFPSDIKKGYEMKFKLKVDGKKATISDFDAENADVAKKIVEGDYSLKSDK